MITLSQPVRHSRLSAIGNALDAAVTGGLLQLYAAPRPGVGEAMGGQILLCEVRLPKPCVASLDGGILTFVPIAETLCQRSGDAAWARLADGDGRWVMDLDVGLPGSGAEVELTRVQLFAGGAVAVTLAELCE